MCNSSVGVSSGIVLDVGCGVVTCAAVWEGREVEGALSCRPSEASLDKLVEMVHSVLQKCDQSMRDKLQATVTITGKSSTHLYSNRADCNCQTSGQRY